ncbi:non-ribosomal peptide synthase/polyketide synthase, partial [Chitinophaga sp. 22308]|uniref:non-ribosomal peptide synthase/polyketide synthase n=1 Tax=Chitinophaga sp. 22308 TaxID=3453906 RepID=UPI003F82DB2D
KGVGPDVLVPVCLERSPDMIISIVGILKAGGAYVPVDPDYPAERIRFMITDTGANLLLTDSRQEAALREMDISPEILLLDESGDLLDSFPTTAMDAGLQRHHLAYVIYTSGSTGKPKGVMNEHGGIVNRLLWKQSYFGLKEGEGVLQKTTFSFDVSVWELLWPLITGARLVFARPQGQKDADYLKEAIRRYDISTVHFVPSMLQVFLDSVGDAETLPLTRIICSGEALKPQQVHDVQLRIPGAELYNLYGPTEAAIDVTCWHAPRHVENNIIPIGQPVSNTQIHILNERGELLPVGVAGELHIGGVQVARGYLNRPELTAERFITDPFNGSGGRLYRTGDLARWLPDGNIEYLGRIDDQVKVRGFRIELGEIESVLQQCELVNQAVVLAISDGADTKRLVAYVVPQGAFDKEGILAWLKARLPEYMVPRLLIELGEIPLTVNGKVDRKALSGPAALLPEQAYVAPRNTTEAKLAAIWERLLGVQRIGIYDDFFAAGGHSLLSMRLVAALRKEMQVILSVNTIFRYSTVALLAAYIREQAQPGNITAIRALPRPERIPLSYSQQRLWFIHQLEGSVHYHMPGVLILDGTLNKPALQSALQAIVNRHEVLRTVVEETGGNDYQRVMDKDAWQWQETDHALSAAEIKALIDQPFDLKRDHMLRAHLIRHHDTRHTLVLTIHHIAGDGWSTGILIKELEELYNACATGKTIQLSPIEIQYADYTLWQQEYLSGDAIQQQLRYWKNQLTGTASLDLPTDHARPAVQSTHGAARIFQLDRTLYADLQALAREEGVTLYMLLLAAFKVLLHRYAGQEDICVGTPVAGRTAAETEPLIGFFTNTLALRTSLNPGLPFSAYLQQVKQVTLNAYDNQDVSFEKVVEALELERDLSRHPLFQVLFTLENTPELNALRLEGLQVTGAEVETHTAKFDLTFSVREVQQGLKLTVEYCTDLFEEATIERMARHFRQLLYAVAATPSATVGALPMLEASEQQQLLFDFNDTAADYPSAATIPDLFRKQAALRPEATAVVFADTTLTYAALNERSDALACYLRDKGVTTETLVPVCMHRAPDMIVVLLAILKAGGAYAPIDPAYPDDRIRYILSDLGGPLLITVSDHRSRLASLQPAQEIVCIDTLTNIPAAGDLTSVELHADNLAYVMYTSGSTGRPKGVLVEHHNVTSLVCDPGYISFTPADAILSAGSVSFDATTFEYWGMLLNGGRLVLSREHELLDVVTLKEELQSRGVNKMFFTTSWFNQLVDTDITVFSGFEVILVGGEKLSESHVEKLLTAYPSIGVGNGYGPTENTTFSLSYRIDRNNLRAVIPIGLPLANRTAYILDGSLQPVPIGVTGELYVGGAGVARGYLNHPELTSSRFLLSPFVAGERIYRTGDLARREADGLITFMGRTDDQVKIRGYRIEPGEIENVLQELAGVKQALVTVRTHAGSGKQLVAYIVPAEDYNKEYIRSALRERLPDYMVPSFIVEMEAFPLNANGKIDRGLLPSPDPGTGSQRAYTAASSPMEMLLVDIWEELLGARRIGVHDNFFELGGHSLLAMREAAVLRNRLEVELPIRSLFQYPTIAELAAYISGLSQENRLPAITAGGRPDRIPLSYSQERLWFIDQLSGSTQFHMQAILELKGELDIAALEQALGAIVNRHEVLRTVMTTENGIAFQQVIPSGNWLLDRIDGPLTSTEIHDIIHRPFDLSADHMLRGHLISQSEDTHILVLTLHHIAADGWSVSIIVKELVAWYNSYTTGTPAQLPDIPVQYADYALWQRKYLTGKILEEKAAYWKQQLAGVAVLELPTDYPRPAEQSTRGTIYQFHLNRPLLDGLKSLSLHEGSTLFMTLLTAFKVLLYRYSGETDICVGTPVAGRTHQETENLIGFFINTLALRSNLSGDPSFVSLLQQVKKTTLNAWEHQEIPFEKVVDAVAVARNMSHSPVFQVMFVLQNTPDVPEIQLGALKLKEQPVERATSQYDLTLSVMEDATGLTASLEYCTDLFRPDTISRMAAHLEVLLEAIVQDPQVNIGALNILPPEEEKMLRWQFNDTEADYPLHQHIIDTFEQQVSRTPDAVALVYESQMLTYRELDERSSALALYLCSRGVQPETLVPFCTERSPEMIIGILGILRAGAAYVPVDPDHPDERVRYILKDTAAGIAVCSSACRHRFPETMEAVCLDGVIPQTEETAAVTLPVLRSGQLAYVIYTSGSTGRPKGVLVEHRGIVNLACSQRDVLHIRQGTPVLQFASFGFDGSCYEIFNTLLNGGILVLPKKDDLLSAESFTALIHRHQVEVAALPPSYLHIIRDMLGPLKTIISVGEAFNKEDGLYISAKGIRMLNGYGPTENTVTVTIAPQPVIDDRVVIGKPIHNVQVHILDENGRLCPVGVPGEICVSGAALARGYLNRPDLTAEKFVQSPYNARFSGRMYKTGDLGRWLADGNIEYAGRKDDQVKVRGFRIELGEIEAVLQECEWVEQAAVAVKTDEFNNKRLVAYIVPRTTFDRDAIVTHLKARLPEYMVPGILQQLEKLPVTVNGKVDRKMLPDPDANELSHNTYTAPRNETESVLAGIWQDLLGISQVGIHDNFFELGGDSIITIQVVSRAKRAGYMLQPRDLFRSQTIAALGELLQENTKQQVTAEQGQLTGAAGLLPVQQWYFDTNGQSGAHFNQQLLLEISKDIAIEKLDKAIQQLAAYHDALRFVYTDHAAGIQQKYGNHIASLETVDLTDFPASELATRINTVGSHYHRSLDPGTGVLFRALLFLTAPGTACNRLLLLVHHLAVDGVSWRILLEDLSLLLNDDVHASPETILGPKTSSYRQWHDALVDYGQSPHLKQQLPYWEGLRQFHTPLRVDREVNGPVTMQDTGTCEVRLDAVQTRNLLQEVPRAYHTDINDILLAALAAAACDWNRSRSVIIGLEGHGREDIISGIDTSRTVGWFTSMYPVLLQPDSTSDVAALVKSVKEQLRKVEDNGVGYMVLKYINRADSLQGKDPWEIGFNYLGQSDNLVQESGYIRMAKESGGDAVGEGFILHDKIFINGAVQNGELILHWGYSSLHYDAATITALADAYLATLRAVINHCLAQAPAFTPSDYGLERWVDYRELDSFLDADYNGTSRRSQVAALYRLSGLQEGMLFHSLYDEKAGTYIEQFKCTLENVNEDVFLQCWKYLLQHHTILRSAFYYDAFNVPVQCVYHQVTLPVTVLEGRQASQLRAIEEADLRQGFDLGIAPLMRITLVRLGEGRYRLLWTSHHLLLDGWSFPVLVQELLEVYGALLNGEQPVVVPEDRYEDYIRFIYRQDKAAEEQYWRNYMRHQTEGTLLPFIDAAQSTKGIGIFREAEVILDATVTTALSQYAQQQRITPNTVMQGVWAFLLYKYIGSQHVTYGITVSGRPESLPGIEQRVGMYINTVPLHVAVSGEREISAWLQELQVDQLNSREYQYAPLNDVQRLTGITGDMFDSALAFQNYPVSDVLASQNWALRISEVMADPISNYPLTIIVTMGENTRLSFNYNSDLLSDDDAFRIAGHFKQALLQIIYKTATHLDDISILAPAEKSQLLYGFNATAVDYPATATIPDLFRIQAAQRPDATAVAFEDTTLTYAELDERSDALAHYLQSKGVTIETLVPVCMHRSPDMMVVLLAILKAGGAYAPIDPDYPDDRVSYILSDLGGPLLITNNRNSERFNTLQPQQEVLCIDTLTDFSSLSGAPAVALRADNLAYVMYTSGSTGRPKGVLVEHRNVTSLIYDQNYITFEPTDAILSAGSVSFDATTFEYWGMLLNGGKLVLSREHDLLDVAVLKEELQNKGVTKMFFTTSWFNQLVDTDITVFEGMKAILVGGEKLSEKHAEKLHTAYPAIALSNIYGPTENTTFSLSYRIDFHGLRAVTPIGVPLSNRTAYVLDRLMQPVPVGVTGELYVGGSGVVRGYLNNEEQTAARFLADPFLEGERIYRTGDLARREADGNITFMGRADDQVKIRGHRIEPGEIESVLHQCPLVKQAFVMAVSDAVHQHKHLAAYIVSQHTFDRASILEYLKEHLPDYMVPSFLVEMESLPLNANGKIDKKALPAPEKETPGTASFVAPRNALEEALTGIWQELLSVPQVGIYDNFFELGGDSIIVIQMVSRIRRAGFELKVGDIFENQTIEKISAHYYSQEGATSNAEQGTLTSSSGLLPIQQWYFENVADTQIPFNQSVLLDIDKSIAATAVDTAIKQLHRHHDALRFTFKKGGPAWEQMYGTHEGQVMVADLRDLSAEELPAAIRDIHDNSQYSLDITRGILCNAVFIQTPAEISGNRLLLTIHHLVIDGVSWRILLEDLALLLQGGDIGTKSSSCREWYQALTNYSGSKRLLDQQSYWTQTVKRNIPLRTDKTTSAPVTAADMKGHTVRLDAHRTRQLLQDVPQAYHTVINDLLLAALAYTLSGWNNNGQVMIGLEGHGRENINDAVDTSRTIGWFTSLFPVLLEVNNDSSYEQLLKDVKEQLRKIADKGLGYGVLKYINRLEPLQEKDPWQVVFNYLGQSDNIVERESFLRIAGESLETAAGGDFPVQHLLAVNAVVQGGELILQWGYSRHHFEADSIHHLAEKYCRCLEALIDQCLSVEAPVFTPADYDLGDVISNRELDIFLDTPYQDATRRRYVSGMSRLSSLQEGMLFHNLFDEGVGAYIDQFACELTGVHPDLFRQAWNEVLLRHSILRTAFYSEAFSVPVQCVYNDIRIPVTVIDYRHLTAGEQEEAVAAFSTADRAKGFDFAAPPLMRLTLLQLSDEKYRLQWTFHHILLDGWSIPVLMEALLQAYEALATGRRPVAVAEDRYEDYIRYLHRRDRQTEEVWWKEYLSGLQEGCLLPFIGTTAARNKGTGEYREHVIYMESAAAERFAQQFHITQNTLMQGLWAFLLYRYTGSRQVAYGVTVSGRPAELEGVEQRVGLYINTLPLHTAIDDGQEIVPWLQDLQAKQTQVRSYQYTSLIDIQRWAGIPGDLFDTLLVFENYPVNHLLAGQPWKLKAGNVEMNEQTNYPLSMAISTGEKITVRFSYNVSLLDDSYVNAIAGHFEQVFTQIVTQEASHIGALNCITPSEKIQLTDTFNDTIKDYPAASNLVELVRKQAAGRPDAIAVIMDGQRLSYAQLEEQSNRLAHYLRELGVTTDTLVPICLERSPEMIISILGIMKAGGAYVPMDIDYPADRIQYILDDTTAGIVITSKNGKHNIPGGLSVIFIDADGEKISRYPAVPLPHTVAPHDLAYVIYTSGSTGRPKGVMVEHAGMLNHLYAKINDLQITDTSVVAYTASPTFDISVWQMMSALLTGGATAIYSEETVLQPTTLLQSIDRDGVTIWEVVPSYLGALLQEQATVALQQLQYLLVTGEVLPRHILAQWFEHPLYGHIPVVNAYGPTEASDDICHHIMHQTPESLNVPLGKPLQNMHIYILDYQNNLCPVGVPGEICVSGICVARGYLNQASLTARRFVADPFRPGVRMYRTGDVGRWLPDGTIEYRGRADDQVKVRGYRIELGEIENVLQQYPGIKQAVVLVKDTATGKQLVGYIVCHSTFDRDGVSAYLKAQLPAYMVPAIWIALDSFPLTANGKIDKQGLPAPDASWRADNYMAPRNEREQLLAGIWSELLNIEAVGIHDNFFEIGGHSLLAMRLTAALRKYEQLDIPVRQIFEHPTIAGLSVYMAGLAKETLPPVTKTPAYPQHLPLSYSQERLWFIDQLEGSVQYHMPAILRMEGALDRKALWNALQTIVNRHEVLRTVIRTSGGQPYQHILEKDKWDWTVITGDYDVDALIRVPFNLSADYMLRAHLVQEGKETHILVLTLHHIAADGWSVRIIVNELTALYKAYSAAEKPLLPALEVQYADYAIWQRNYVSGKVLERKLDYWKDKLTGTTPLQLSTDYPYPAVQTGRGASSHFHLSKEMADALQGFSQQQGVTLFMTLLAAFKVLLYHYSGQEDICVGTPVADRTQLETENLIGFFVNTLALRSNLAHNPAFTELLQQVKQTTLDAYDHQDAPFEKVVEVAIKEHDRSRSPLFQVMMALQNMPEASILELEDLRLLPVSAEQTTSRFDLTFILSVTSQGLEGNIEYSTDLFNGNTINRMAAHFEQLLTDILRAPATPVALLSVLSPAETHAITVDFNDIPASYTLQPDKTALDLFAACVANAPDAPAVLQGDSMLTYKALDERSSQLARYLQDKGVTAETLVPVFINRTPEMIIAVMGILKAGGAFVPVDPEYPAERVQYMLSDTGATLLISNRATIQRLQVKQQPDVILLDDEQHIIDAYPVTQPATCPSPDQLAYVIYTSGSTGRPKGVMVEHRGVYNLVQSQRDALHLRPGMRSLQFASFSFDAACYEIFNTLTSGGTLVLPEEEDLLSVARFASLLERQHVELVTLPPSYQRVVKDVLGPVKTVVSAGEALRVEDARHMMKKGVRVVNAYGPTENTVCSTLTGDPVRPDNTVVIGRPVANVQVYILNAWGGLCPVGVKGEICVSGPGLARGYLHRPDLTAASFVTTPSGYRIYKTGDVGRWLPDGNIEYLGRADEQVKVRGYRIELEEIENVIEEHSEVSQAVVLVQPTDQHDKMLTGYIVRQGSIDQEGLLSWLRTRLPQYMVPAMLTFLDELPLTPSGKIDKKALLRLDLGIARTKEYVAPAGETEQTLVTMWEALLNVQRIGVHDNFFEIGGHSLLAMRVLAAVQETYGVTLPVSTFFQLPTISALAVHIQVNRQDVQLNKADTRSINL